MNRQADVDNVVCSVFWALKLFIGNFRLLPEMDSRINLVRVFLGGSGHISRVDHHDTPDILLILTLLCSLGCGRKELPGIVSHGTLIDPGFCL
jgi:hypothetical protein